MTAQNSPDTLLIQPLAGEHQRQGFDCGATSLNDYLQKQARLDVKRRISRVFVASMPARPTAILGYYSLSSLSIHLATLPETLARKLPRHPIPAALIGRLAVAQSAQGQGIGRLMLADALSRTLAASVQIGIYALVVDAIDGKAQGFYERFGFSRLASEGRRLFLPLQSL